MTCLRTINKNESEINNKIIDVIIDKRKKKVIFVEHSVCFYCNEKVTSHQHWCKGCLGDYCALERYKNQNCPKHSYTHSEFSNIVCEKCGLIACNYCVNPTAEAMTNCQRARSSFHSISPLQFLCKKCFPKNQSR